MMSLLQHKAQSILLITEAVVHYVSEVTPQTSHNPWVRFPPLCSGTLIFISSCLSSQDLYYTVSFLSFFFFCPFSANSPPSALASVCEEKQRGKKTGKSSFSSSTFIPLLCLCSSQSLRSDLFFLLCINRIKPFERMKLHINFKPASPLVQRVPPTPPPKIKKKKKEGREGKGSYPFHVQPLSQ